MVRPVSVGGVRPDEASGRAERARAVALFRYQLIREAADPAHSTRQRGRMVRELAARTHLDPAGRPVRVSRETLDRWIRAWRRGGFDALVPHPRQSSRRLPAEVLDLAVALKKENPDRRDPGAADPARPAGLGPWGAHAAAPLRRARLGRPHRAGRDCGAGVRAVRGAAPQRALDRGRAARTRIGGRKTYPNTLTSHEVGQAMCNGRACELVDLLTLAQVTPRSCGDHAQRRCHRRHTGTFHDWASRSDNGS